MLVDIRFSDPAFEEYCGGDKFHYCRDAIYEEIMTEANIMKVGSDEFPVAFKRVRVNNVHAVEGDYTYLLHNCQYITFNSSI